MIDDAALTHNIEWMSEWVGSRGLELMPHGKTTMSPAIWRRQLDRPHTTGLTLATPWQVRVAREAGVVDVMLANELTDPSALRWIAEDVSTRGGHVWSWIDDPASIEIAEGALDASSNQSLEVLIELGVSSGRTGVRSRSSAIQLMESIAASPVMRLVGVAGYEGAVAHDRSAEADAAVNRYMDDLVDLHHIAKRYYETDAPIVSAGGSVYPDIVARSLSAAAGAARLVLRSGAYVVHDEGFYRTVSPFEGRGHDGLRPAARGIARVLSMPEPGLALVDAGKRDLPYDEGLPDPLFAVSRTGKRLALEGAKTIRLNDQHAFLHVESGAGLAVGDLVVFGLSHPCTMFDKWRAIPLVSSIEDPFHATVIDVVETYF